MRRRTQRLLPVLAALILLPAAAALALSYGTPNGGAPPLCYINSPGNGATVPAGRPLTVKAGANSFNGVARVSFFVDGREVATDHSRPYEYTFTPGSGSHTVRAKATGYMGNWKMSNPVTFTAR
ncbi:MAG: Ig-like domain-containing protein [Verrucomicrobiota bacterium]